MPNNTTKKTTPIFTKGSTVEVTSDEEGFKGVWFEAKVISTKKKNVYVEYKSIVSEENGTQPLKEFVNSSFVRPVPPPIVEQIEGFELYDVVDAFYKDGWWTGVITRVFLEDEKYQVTFHNPPDELVFGVTDLRFHHIWVNGNWVRPGKQRTGALMFSVGKKVEVSFDRDGCRDAWFPATVLEDCGNDSFLVEYRRPGSGDEAVVGKVTVDSFHIRPCPPHIQINQFSLLEKVDAYYDFGWWSGGIITKELADCRYLVFFKNKMKTMELNGSDLRLHMDWKDGKWSSSSQDVSIPSDCQTNQNNNCQDTSILQKDAPLGRSSAMSEISEKGTEPSLKYLKDLSETPSVNEISSKETLQNDLSNSNAASSQPLELAKEAPEAPKMSLEPCKLRAKPSATPRTPHTKSPIDSSSPNSEYDGIKISVPVAGDEQYTRVWEKRTRKRCRELGDGNNGTLEKFQAANSTSKSTKRGSKSIAFENAADVTQKCSTRKETDGPVILGLECSKVTSSRGKRQIDNGSLEPIGDQKQIDASMDGIQDSKQVDDGESSQKKRRVGRPRRKSISTPIDTAQSGDHMKDESLGNAESPIMVFEDSEEKLEVQMGHNGKRGRMKKMVQMKRSNEKAVQSSYQQHEKHYIKRGKRQPRSANIESRAQGSGDPTGVKTTESNGMASDGEEILAEVPYNGFDDQPLAKWFEEMQSPTSVDGSRVSTACSPKQCAEMGEKQDMPTQTSVSMNPTTQTETQSLPFVKNTHLWATIESMDIFRRIPQKPHFRPLEQCKESSREGVAIGCMVTFTSIVAKTSSLRYDDPRSTIEEILETLSDLENHGFDVQLVRNRLTMLLLMKDKQEKLEAQTAEIDNHIIKCNSDGKIIDGEIEDINKQIAELQDKLSLAVSRKEVKDREIDALRSQLEDIQVNMKNAQSEFEGFASKPL